MFDATKLSAKELTEEARNLGVPGWDKMKRPALEEAVSKAKDKKDKKAKKGKKEKTEKVVASKPAPAKSDSKAKDSSKTKPAAKTPAKKAPAKKASAPKKAAATKSAAKPKTAAPKKSAPAKKAAPKKAAAKKAPASKKAAPKKSTAKAPAKGKTPAKKSAPKKPAAPKAKVKPGENPYRKGSAIYTIHQLLAKGGKRRTLAEKLKAKIGPLHPYTPEKSSTLADYDKRLLLGAQEGKKHGFREVRKGRGLDGTIKVEYVGKKNAKAVRNK